MFHTQIKLFHITKSVTILPFHLTPARQTSMHNIKALEHQAKGVMKFIG
jgi:hypothetical protein